MTQRNIDRLLLTVLEQARALKIPISSRVAPHVRLNRRARNRFGCCIRGEDGYVIELSARLAEEGSVEAISQVLAHEVLHTCHGCSNHGQRWKGYAARMNAAYGYSIRRSDGFETLGLTDDRPVRYLVVCQKCGRRIPRMKRSPLVDHPERYRCKCGGALRVADGDQFDLFDQF